MVFLISILSAGGDIAASDPLQQNLFTVVDGPVEGVVNDQMEDPTVVRSRLVGINFEVLSRNGGAPQAAGDASNLLSLNLFDDVFFTAVLDGWNRTNSGSYAWTGHLDGIDNSHVVLIVKNSVVSGNITLPDAFYQIRYKADLLHGMYKIDQSAFPPEKEPIPVDASRGKTAFDTEMGDDGSVIDVLVVYTGAARTGAGGTTAMETLIDLAVAETNTGYGNSGITQRVNLVHTAEVSYDESGFNWSTTLGRLQLTADGYIDNVHTLRNTYAADAVVLIVNDSGSCGIGYLMTIVTPSFKDWAFTVVARSCAAGYYSFAHELGHNMGALHDWYLDNGVNPYTYSHGYVAPLKNWRTIMAYGNDCSNCTRRNYWSNPDVLYGGVPMGVPEGTSTACSAGVPTPNCDADNHKTLNNTAYTVANFRQGAVITPPAVTTTALSSITSTTASSGGTVTADGGGTVTARGVCWNTSVNPTINNTHTTDGAGTGSFASAITGLTPGGTYHVRAYATNSADTAYGDDLEFTTAATLYVSQNGTCGGNTPCYTLIQQAINSAGTGFTIKIDQGSYIESISLNTSKSLTLTAGWNTAFATQSPNTTFIKAPSVSQGSLTFQMITIKP